MRHFIGIDVGKFGAIAIIDRRGVVIDLFDMPTAGGELDKFELINILKYCTENCEPFFLVEKCQYTPQIKGKGAYTFGKAVMAIEMSMIWLGHKHEYVRPQKWKKEFGLIKKVKQASVIKARELFPSSASDLKKSKDGRAEALLIAEYGRRYY